jgi:hypothetical protein
VTPLGSSGRHSRTETNPGSIHSGVVHVRMQVPGGPLRGAGGQSACVCQDRGIVVDVDDPGVRGDVLRHLVTGA